MNETGRILLALLAGGATVYTFWRAETMQLTTVQYGVVATVVITAAIHLLAGPAEPWLYLNGMGFLLLALYFLPLTRLHPLITWVFIAYTLLTVALYFVVHPWGMLNGNVDVLGIFTKVVEGILVLLLLMDWRQSVPETAT